MGVDYLEGTYLGERIADKVKKVDFINSNFFLLVLEITKTEPDLEAVEKIISRDVTLTYSIFKLVNSVYYATKIRPASIKQALVILGISGLKQWIYLLSFRQGEEDLHEDLVKRSFLRANYCSELYAYTNIKEITESESYLMGMFSTLGILLGVPLADALAEIHISEHIKEALLNNSGPCGILYNLVLSYERADWKQINKYVEQLNIPKDKVAQIYFNCVEKVNDTWIAFRSP
jgi:EAL and modified HD-GYP domain-containing signal transduction protein